MYDCTKDVKKHIDKVQYWLRDFSNRLLSRAEVHDKSKLSDPLEKTTYDRWTPVLQQVAYGSDEYKQALMGMGDGLKRHYRANRHHPEHFEHGINDMTLMDLVEMLADWMASAEAKGTHVDLTRAAERFGISEQLVQILANTLREDDLWNLIDGVPMSELCPPEYRDGYIDSRDRK